MQTDSISSDVPAARQLRSSPDRMRLEQMVSELRQLGMTPSLRITSDGISGNGAGICLSVRQLVSNPAVLATAVERLRGLLLRGQAVTLSLLDAGSCSSRRLERVLRQLHRASAAPCIDRSRIGLLVGANAVPLPGFLLMSRVLLGSGPRYVLLDESVNTDTGGANDNAAVWSALYQQRLRMPQLLPVYAGDVRSRCPLLNDERCSVVLDPGAILSPPDAACLVIDFNLCRYANAAGELCEEALLRALRRGLRTADRLFDGLHWSDLKQRRDAMVNRRIAFAVAGVGDLVRLQRRDVGSFACLRDFDRLLGKMHHCLWRESMRLATDRGPLPALLNKDPSRRLPAGGQRQHWQERWQAALASTAVRHRCLLVMSPYTLLPLAGKATSAHFNLLPLLAHADACSFAGGAGHADWNIKEFKDFHCRARAILQRRTASSFVAAGV